tara:strand:+ start:558 stop:1223 length:666 start_codon:yes stop_codon:yes gene_type:complete
MCSVSGYDDILIYLNGVGESEDLDQWDLIDASIDDNETESEDFEAMLNDTMSVALTATAPGDTRNKNSVQDNKFVKVRYLYVQGSKRFGSSKSKKMRPFCRAMESARKVYRKEDILKMQTDGVNSQLGHNKQAYSLWLHKGGVNCYHKFERRIYLKRVKNDGNPYAGGALTGVKRASIKEARKKGFNPKSNRFKNNKRVAEAQIDRADKGHHPSYVKPKKK